MRQSVNQSVIRMYMSFSLLSQSVYQVSQVNLQSVKQWIYPENQTVTQSVGQSVKYAVSQSGKSVRLSVSPVNQRVS